MAIEIWIFRPIWLWAPLALITYLATAAGKQQLFGQVLTGADHGQRSCCLLEASGPWILFLYCSSTSWTSSKTHLLMSWRPNLLLPIIRFLVGSVWWLIWWCKLYENESLLPGVPNLGCSDKGFHHLADAVERCITRSQTFIQCRKMISKPLSERAGASQRPGIQGCSPKDLGKYTSKNQTTQCSIRGCVHSVCTNSFRWAYISLYVMVWHLNVPQKSTC